MVHQPDFTLRRWQLGEIECTVPAKCAKYRPDKHTAPLQISMQTLMTTWSAGGCVTHCPLSFLHSASASRCMSSSRLVSSLCTTVVAEAELCLGWGTSLPDTCPGYRVRFKIYIIHFLIYIFKKGIKKMRIFPQYYRIHPGICGWTDMIGHILQDNICMGVLPVHVVLMCGFCNLTAWLVITCAAASTS